MHDRNRFLTPSCSADALGGITLEDLPPRARVDDPAITAVTVADAPEVQALDLRGCRRGVHVTLSGVPALRHLHLPEGRPGAVVHLAADSPPTLALTGLIEELDACWPGFDFRLADRGRAPWRGAVIGASLPKTATDVVVLTTRATWEAAPSGQTPRDLFLLGTTVADGRIDLHDAPRLEALRAKHVTAFGSLHVPTGIREVTLERCEGTHRIQGAGGNLQLRSCAGAHCRIDGVWTHALVEGARFERLSAPLVQYLELRNTAEGLTLDHGEESEVCLTGASPRIAGGRPVQLTRGFGRASAGLLQRVAQRDTEATDQLTWALTRPASRQEWMMRLQALAGAIGQLDPGLLWRLRCLTHAAHNGADPECVSVNGAWYTSGDTWTWRFPADIARAGWALDLQLFEAAIDRPETAPFRELLRRARGIHQLAAVSDVVARARQRRREPLPLFVEVLRTRLPTVARRHSRQHRALTIAQLESLLRGAVMIGDTGAARALHRLARKTLGPAARLGLLRTLAQHGLVQARAELWALARNTRELDEGQRERALKGALAPPRFGTFAAAEEVRT